MMINLAASKPSNSYLQDYSWPIPSPASVVNSSLDFSEGLFGSLLFERSLIFLSRAIG